MKTKDTNNMSLPDQPKTSYTPRTDAELYPMNGVDIVWPEFARTLERELAETERLRFGADADRRRLRCELAAASQAYECAMAIHGTVMEERDRLATELTAARSERDLAITRVACILWSGAIDKHTCGDVQKWADYYTAELTRLRAFGDQLSNNLSAVGAAYNSEKARAEKAEADNAKWQKLLLMSRDDREIDLISEIEEQARLLGMSGEREADLLGKLGRLESELAAIKNGHGELGKYEQLRLKNAELQRDKARLDWLAVSDTWFDYPATESFNPETFRDAIDAAMKGTP